MFQEWIAYLRWLLGIDVTTLTLWQMALRALIVYVVTLGMVQLLGGRRLIGKHAALDVILGIIFGSVLSRAVNGDAPFFETLGAGAILIGLHWLFAMIAFRSHGFGKLVKGGSPILIDRGEIQWANMRKHGISERDLLESLRLNGQLTGPEHVRTARLERNGDISVIPRHNQLAIVDVVVEAGVQTVRIELSS